MFAPVFGVLWNVWFAGLITSPMYTMVGLIFRGVVAVIFGIAFYCVWDLQPTIVFCAVSRIRSILWYMVRGDYLRSRRACASEYSHGVVGMQYAVGVRGFTASRSPCVSCLS